MRKPRELVPEGMLGVYHVVSRVMDGSMVFGEEEKSLFVKMMNDYAGFSGMTLLSWFVKGNHFHILIEAPNVPTQNLPESEVLLRMALIYDAGEITEFCRVLDACDSPEERRTLLLPYTRRMGNLSLFIKTLKQRFSQCFNRVHKRRGTLWGERFQSTIVYCEEYSPHRLVAPPALDTP